MAVFSWDIVSPVDYAAGVELDFNLHFEAPADIEPGRYYCLGDHDS